MKLKGILFDFNGTLFFDSDMHVEAFKRVFAEYRMVAPPRETMIERFFGRNNRTIYLENFNENATDEEIARFIEKKENAYFDICRELGDELSLAKGAEEFLDAVKEMGIPYCLATGSEKGSVDFYMDILDLGRWFTFDNIVHENGTFAGKPAPDIYRLAARKIGLDPSECLVFEDGTSGIMSANAAGVGAVVVVYDKKYPSPLNDKTRVDEVMFDHTDWKNTLSKYLDLE